MKANLNIMTKFMQLRFAHFNITDNGANILLSNFAVKFLGHNCTPYCDLGLVLHHSNHLLSHKEAQKTGQPVCAL